MTERPDWQRAFEMLGTDGTDLIPILLAADGSMYAVLQGEYAGALRTVKLDDEGRLSAFVIDSTDAWGRMLTVGNAELAARVGSPVVFEQSGRVQLVETFKHGLQRWEINKSGLGAGAEIYPQTYVSDGYSVRMISGSTLSHYIELARGAGIFPTVGIGLSFAYATEGDFETIRFRIACYDGAHLHNIVGRLRADTDVLTIEDEDGNEQTIITANPHTGHPLTYHTVKITADLTTQHYLKLRYNQTEADISGYLYRKTVSGVSPAIYLYLRHTGTLGDNDRMYIDSIILTVGEE